jgi:hypothetical protein
MPMKGDGSTTLREIDRFEGGVGWVAYPDETMERASHALQTDEGLWLVDPVDAANLDELLAEFGEVAGVVVCLDRHKRDSAAIARRHDVAVHVPSWMTGVATEIDAPIDRFAGELGSSGYELFEIRNSSVPPWQEAGLYSSDTGTLVVPESVGTADYFLTDGERLGVHPMLRLFPPQDVLGRFSPDRILVGHGEGVLSDATGALDAALSTSKRNALSLYGKTVKQFMTG